MSALLDQSLLLPISIYLMFGLQGALLCTLLYLLLAASYSTGFPKHLTGFIDSQLALIVELSSVSPSVKYVLTQSAVVSVHTYIDQAVTSVEDADGDLAQKRFSQICSREKEVLIHGFDETSSKKDKPI